MTRPTSCCLYDTRTDPWYVRMYVCMYDIEGGGKSKYCTIGNFLSWTFMGTKWGRHCQDLTQVIIELLVCMDQLCKLLITEPNDLYGYYKSWSLDSGDVTLSLCFTKAYFNIMLQFLPVSHIPSILFSNQNFCVVFVISSYHTTGPFRCILYHIILGKEYGSCGS
jgi:hypothetical protein